MLHKASYYFTIVSIALCCIWPNTLLADDDLLLLVMPLMTHPAASNGLHANIAGASQLYTLSGSVQHATSNDPNDHVFHYKLLEKKAGKNATIGASNLLSVTSAGTANIALSSDTGSVMALYSVTDPDGNYVYIALDYTDADTLSIIKKLNTGLIRVSLSSNAIESMAPGYVVTPMASSYYSMMQIGQKPIQFDSQGNVLFNAYPISGGAIQSSVASLEKITLPAKTITTLTDNSQSILFFVTLTENTEGNVVFLASSSIDHTATLWLYKPTASVPFINLTNATSGSYPISYFFKDDSSGIIFKERGNNAGKLTFARSKSGGGADKAYLPDSNAWFVVGDDGQLYGVSTNTSGQILVSTILPYATTPFVTVNMGSATTFPWASTPVQISKSYLYFVARVDPGDGYGTKDVITVHGLTTATEQTILNDRRFDIYAWRQTGGNDKLYFTARDKAATTSTIYSGKIDTVKLQEGLPQDQYLTLQAVASATGAAAAIKDLEILAPQPPVVDPGYNPVINSYYTNMANAQGIIFSKYMNKTKVEAGLDFGVRDGGSISYLPVWFLHSLYLIPDLDGLGNSSTTPLNSSTCYSLAITGNVTDLWNWPLSGAQQPLSTTIGAACNATQCTYDLSTHSLAFGSSGGSKTLAVTTNAASCAWVSQNAPSWLTVTASGTGSGTVTVTAAANTASTSRSATITIAGESVTVTQAGYVPVCSYSVSSSSLSVPASGGSQSITVGTSSSSCSWTASESLSWLSITSGSSGTGSGTVTLSISSNTATSSRSGTILVAGYTVTITQAGAAVTTGFADDFKATPISSNWKSVNCLWSYNTTYTDPANSTVLGIEYPHLTGSGVLSTLLYDVSFSNFAYTAFMKRNISETSSNYIVFRGTYSPWTSTNKWNSWYFFAYANTGRYLVARIVNGTETILKGWTTSSYITPYSWNWLAVSAVGSSLKFYINNQLVFETTDTNLTSGRAGFGCYDDGSDGSSGTFYVDYAALLSSSAGSDAPQTAFPTKSPRLEALLQRLTDEQNAPAQPAPSLPAQGLDSIRGDFYHK